MEELIKRLERVIQTGVPDKDGQHPITAEVVLEVVKAQLSTNLAEVGTDAISRQQAIEAVRMVIGDNRSISVCDAIKQLPPIQPKRGKWERHYSRPNVYADLFWHCSECGYKDSENYAPVYHHFCTNCGADMRGEQDE